MRGNLIIGLSGLLFASCVWLEDKLSGEPPELVFHILPKLNMNANGYYLLPLNSAGDRKTVHTVYGYVGLRDYDTFDFIDSENKAVSWTSNLYWVKNDTVGYYRKRKVYDRVYTYMTADTAFTYSGDTTAFKSTVGCCSTSDEKGMVSTTITVLSQMAGDTLVLEAGTLDEYDNCPTDTCYVSVPILIFK